MFTEKRAAGGSISVNSSPPLLLFARGTWWCTGWRRESVERGRIITPEFVKIRREDFKHRRGFLASLRGRDESRARLTRETLRSVSLANWREIIVFNVLMFTQVSVLLFKHEQSVSREKQRFRENISHVFGGENFFSIQKRAC